MGVAGTATPCGQIEVLEVDVRLRRKDFELEAAFAAATPGVTALFGRSGSGKTTLVELIAGLHRAGPRPNRARRLGAARLGTADTRCRRSGAASAMCSRIRCCSRTSTSPATSATGSVAPSRAAPRPSSPTRSRCSASAACCTGGRTSSRAASASGSRSGARCCRVRDCCCSTSRWPRSTRRVARSSCPGSRRCATGTRYRSST